MSKHLKNEYTSKKIKKNRNIIIAIVLIIIFVIGFEIGILTKNINEKNEIKESINNFFDALKNSDQDKVNKYSNYNQIVDSLDTMILQYDNVELEKELFYRIEWKIENIEKNDNDIIATVEVKNKDFKNIILNWMKDLVSEKSSGTEITNEYALEKLKNKINEEESFKTVVKKIVLNDNDEGIKITVNEDLRDLLFPGIDSVIEVLKNNKS